MSAFFKTVCTAFIVGFSVGCQSNDMNPLDQILNSDMPKIKAIADQLDQHNVQILYTQIDRDEKGHPTFKEFTFQLDDDLYFYPASTAKLPVAILAIQKVRQLQAAGVQIGLDDRFVIKDTSGKVIIAQDSTAETGYPSIRHMIKKIFLVSDNDAYNYLFDFLGRDFVNKELNKRNLGPSHLNHKFLYGADNKNTWAFAFYNAQNELTYAQQSITSVIEKHNYPLKDIEKGIGYTDNDGTLYQEPFDFSEKNFFSLKSLNNIMRAIIFPESIPNDNRFDLNKEDYEFLRFWMSRNTFESDYPNYQTDGYFESYVKFFLFGDDQGPMPDNIRSYNKVGNAYGTLTEIAYVLDSTNEVEYMLAATILVNQNQIFNDGVYEYDSLGIPFMAELGRQIHAYELAR